MNLQELSQRLPQTGRGRIVLIAVALLGIIAAVVITRMKSAGADKPAATPAALTVTVTTLETAKLARSMVANGTVFPWQEIIIGPEVGGYRVANVRVYVGDRVRKGQELVRLADDLLSAEVSSKRASVQQAQAALTNAASALRRAEPLATSGVLSASDLDTLRSEEIAAGARVQVAKAEL